jgi:deoxyribose-phosphate aldolase
MTKSPPAARLASMPGANFVKTSTGFSKAGATVHAVQLMRAAVGDRCGVKASVASIPKKKCSR